MPWTMKQFRFLMSKSSPLTEAQKEKDKGEAHADPSLVHHERGSSRMAERWAARKERR
jgi:hypothetical protein